MEMPVRSLFVVFASITLLACGGEDSSEGEEDQNQSSEVETVECGADTLEVDGQCVAAVECGEGETATNDGRCVYSDYCGDGTRFNPGPGQCVADADLLCGDQTAEEDGECVAEVVITCGEGTIVSDETCLPTEEVCGDGTEVDNEQLCRPVDDVCGEGTTFDFSRRVCVPVSFLACGPGTMEQDENCISSRIFYEELAADFDVDLNDYSESVEVTLKGVGEHFVFIGTIEEPEIDGGELLPNDDHLHFDADAGQWIRIGLYSLGLPTPGFLFFDDEESFTRLSDLGGGVEVVRDVLIPRDETFHLTISSLAQLLGEVGPAGGDDWHYVGFVEVLEAPDARPLGDDEVWEGDIRELVDNFYLVEDLGPEVSVALIFETLPESAESQIQIWTDPVTLESTLELNDDTVVFEAPQESFYLLLDRVHAFGSDTAYQGVAKVGTPIDDGGAITEDVELEAGEYIGLSQYNLEGVELSATISDSGTVLADTDELRVFDASTGQVGLYWYAASDQTVTLTWENTTGQDLDFFSTAYEVHQADFQGGIDGDSVQFSTDLELSRGHRHYVELEVNLSQQTMLGFTLGDPGEGHLTLFDQSGQQLADGEGSFVQDLESGSYLLAVDALSQMPSGFEITIREMRLFSASETGTFIDSYSETSLLLNISAECIVESLEISILTDSLWQDDTTIDLIAPDETEYRLVNPGPTTRDPIDVTFPSPDSPVDSLAGLIGQSGQGDWEIRYTYVWSDDGYVDWSLDILCE